VVNGYDSLKPVKYLLAVFFSDLSAAVVDVQTIMRFVLFKTRRDDAPIAPELDGIAEEVPVDSLQPGLVGADGNGTGRDGPETIVDDNITPGDIIREFLQHRIDDILPQVQHLAFHFHRAPDNGGFPEAILRGPRQTGG